MKKVIHKLMYPTNTKLGLFVLRLTLGGIFIFHGITKLTNMEQTIGFFGMIGFSAFFAWMISLIEVIGGVLVVLGIYTRYIVPLFAIIMLTVIIFIKRKSGFQSIELEVAILGLSLGVGLIGCGEYSICSMFHNKDCKSGVCKTGCKCSCESE